MPRFFIDLHDGVEFVRDADGFDLPDLDAARERVLRIMSKIAQGFTGPAPRRDYVAAVRDSGGVRMRVRMSLDIETDPEAGPT